MPRRYAVERHYSRGASVSPGQGAVLPAGRRWKRRAAVLRTPGPAGRAGLASPPADGVAPATKELIDTETRRIITECYEQAVTTLHDHRDRLDRLDRLAHTLLDQETLDEDEAYAAAGIQSGAAPAAIARGEAAGMAVSDG